MRNLSKSKIIAYLQCPRRIWLEVHKPEERVDSDSTQASFVAGNNVGDMARTIYDPDQKGELLNPQKDGFAYVFERSLELLESNRPIFEAGFTYNGALSLADVLLPQKSKGKKCWRMVEVKSSTGVKDYHRDDIAIQAYIARNAGVPLASVHLAHVDKKWVYPGNGDYAGLLMEYDLSEEVIARENEVIEWIEGAQKTVAKRTEPKAQTGSQCSSPFSCGFIDYCQSKERQAKYPAQWLPNLKTKAIKQYIADNHPLDLRDTPNDLLTPQQVMVKKHTLSGKRYFDADGAANELKDYGFPAYFLDFETIQFAVPIWKNTSPYQALPFQFSLHRINRSGKLESDYFLDLSGDDPTKGFAEAVIQACGKSGPIYVYNKDFEGGVLKRLAERYKKLAPQLLAAKERLVDLHPITEANYYHPDQHGSWSIKAVLPTIAPELRYDQLDGVQDGSMAMTAYMEAINPDTPRDRKEQIRQQLLSYCGLDTYAMVKLWQFLAGRHDLDL